MNHNDLVTIPDHTPARRYTKDLATRLCASRVYREIPLDAQELQLILSCALHMACRDILEGRFVPLEYIGEFVAVDNHGPCIRYQADRKLLESCCIQNLKRQGVQQHG